MNYYLPLFNYSLDRERNLLSVFNYFITLYFWYVHMVVNPWCSYQRAFQTFLRSNICLYANFHNAHKSRSFSRSLCLYRINFVSGFKIETRWKSDDPHNLNGIWNQCQIGKHYLSHPSNVCFFIYSWQLLRCTKRITWRCVTD